MHVPVLLSLALNLHMPEGGDLPGLVKSPRLYSTVLLTASLCSFMEAGRRHRSLGLECSTVCFSSIAAARRSALPWPVVKALMLTGGRKDVIRTTAHTMGGVTRDEAQPWETPVFFNRW